MKLFEFDPNKTAVINPWDIKKPVPNFPKTIVSCFPHNLIDYTVNEYEAEEIATTGSANGSDYIYQMEVAGKSIGLVMVRVGASMTVGMCEELAVMGAEHIILFGTCGVLSHEIDDCAIILPNQALRDEGTSFHYAPPSDEIAVNVGTLESMIAFFEEKGIFHTVGKVWTTDAFYRETREKVERRKEAGCVCVDMECSAVAAWAQFREKKVSHFFYAADNLSKSKWDARSLGNHANVDEKMKIMDLAIELAISVTE